MKQKLKIYHPKTKIEVLQIFAVLCIILYGISFFFVREIETVASFPGIFKKTISYQDSFLSPEIIQIKGSDGNTIQGIYIDRGSKKTIYYFHGNGESLPYFYQDIKYIAQLGYNILAYDYPGYGLSEGFPYQESISDASDRIYKYLKIRKDLEEKDIIVWGYSVGTAAAIDFATRHKNIDRMVLMSPLSSRYDISHHLFGFPLQKGLKKEDSFVSYRSVREFDFPVFIIHGTDDTIVPFWQGKKVFENYKGEKYFLDLENTGHTNILQIHGKTLKSPLRVFLSMKNKKSQQ